jgi:uncharacterized short protein YbdD (DUF466 family)
VTGTGEAGAPAPAVADAAVAARRARRARLMERARSLRQAYLQVFGIPDYEGYLAHMRAQHPGKPVLSEREFAARAIERKYTLRGPRCC